MKPAVAEAIERLRGVYPVVASDDGEGGARVIVEDVELDGATTWFGFHITFQYPYADIYPHYVRADLIRRDGGSLVGAGINPNNAFEGRPAIMLSRRSNNLNAVNDTALLKLKKVIAWLEENR